MKVYAKLNGKLATWEVGTTDPNLAIKTVQGTLPPKQITVLAVISKEVTNESIHSRPDNGPSLA